MKFGRNWVQIEREIRGGLKMGARSKDASVAVTVHVF